MTKKNNFLSRLLNKGSKSNTIDDIINQPLIDEETKTEFIEEILNLDDVILPLRYKDTKWGEFKQKILSKTISGHGFFEDCIRCLNDDLIPFIKDVFELKNIKLLKTIENDYELKAEFLVKKKILQEFVGNVNENYR